MLDELKEYEQYTFDLDDLPGGLPADLRLRKSRFLDNGFSGVARAMLVIARRQLFPNGADEQPGPDDLVRVEGVLKHWCGFASDSDGALPPKLSQLDNWVCRYIEALCKSQGGRGWRAKAEFFNAKWQNKAARYDARFFDGWKNDHNRVCYEMVVAEALRQGPLRRHYLARRLLPGEAPSEDRLFDPGRKDEKLLKQSAAFGRKLNGSNNKYVLEMTAAALLQNGNPGPDGLGEEWLYAKTGFDRLRDWACVDGKEALKRDDVCGWLYRDKTLFGARSLGASGSLWCVRSSWIEDCGWQLVDSESDDCLRKAYGAGECTFFSEVGFGARIGEGGLDKAYPYYPFAKNEFYR